jgi:serine/threonine protein kinase
MADDIYSLGVVLVLLIKGDLENLVDKPKDTQRILEYHSRVDGIYVELSAQVVKKLSGEISPQLYHLFRRTLNRIRNYRIDINGVRSHPWLRQQETQ